MRRDGLQTALATEGRHRPVSAPKQATGYQGSQKSNLRKETPAAQALFSAPLSPLPADDTVKRSDQPHSPIVPIADDVSIPDFLKREPAADRGSKRLRPKIRQEIANENV